jgi:hypothetical protein
MSTIGQAAEENRLGALWDNLEKGWPGEPLKAVTAIQAFCV